MHEVEADEWLDLVDEHDQIIGVIAREDAWTTSGIRLRVVNALVVNARGELWIPRRTPKKGLFPGGLDLSVGGHVQSGESYLEAFKREALEELNLDVDRVPWRELAHLGPDRDGVSAFMRLYEVRLEQAPAFDPEEFSEAFWVKPAALLERLRSGEAAKDDLRRVVERLFPAL